MKQKLQNTTKYVLLRLINIFFRHELHEFSRIKIFAINYEVKKLVEIRVIRGKQTPTVSKKIKSLLKLFLFSVLLQYQKVRFVEFKKTSKQSARKSWNFFS